MTVSDVGSGDCAIDVSSHGLVLTALSGDTRVWSSGDCATRASDERQLSSGDSYQETMVWTRVHSRPGCAPNQPAAAPGSYTAVASVAGVSSDSITFQLS